jgi:hypothetical protein
MEQAGWITDENGCPARIYELTTARKDAARNRKVTLAAGTAAVNRVLRMA